MPADHEMSAFGRFFWRLAIFGPLVAVPAWLVMTSPFPPVDAARHYLSFAGCPVANILGTAPAVEGEPGYHARLDPDGLGTACRPVPQRDLKGGSTVKFLRPDG